MAGNNYLRQARFCTCRKSREPRFLFAVDRETGFLTAYAAGDVSWENSQRVSRYILL
jgi:hypothetical protein